MLCRHSRSLSAAHEAVWQRLVEKGVVEADPDDAQGNAKQQELAEKLVREEVATMGEDDLADMD